MTVDRYTITTLDRYWHPYRRIHNWKLCILRPERFRDPRIAAFVP